MRNKLLTLLAVTALIAGANIQANTISEDEVTAYVMKSFHEDGTFAGLSNEEISNFETIVELGVKTELAKLDGEFELSEAGRDAFLVDTFKSVGSAIAGAAGKGFELVKSVGGKIISGIKGLATRAIDVAKKVATKIGPILQKMGPKLVAMASKFNPKYAGAAEALMGLVPGLTQKQAEGAVAATTQGAGETKTPEEATASALDLLNSMPTN